MATIPIKITDEATPGLRAYIEALSNKRPLLQFVGNAVKQTIRYHLIQRSASQRNKFGARSSGFWGKAAASVAGQAMVVDRESVTIPLNHPGFPRAFGPVDIYPKGGSGTGGCAGKGLYLAIPLIAQAYNKRACRQKGLFFFTSKKGNKLLAERIPDSRGQKPKLKPWYMLVPSVHQDQDRTILPTDAAIEAAALKGVDIYLQGVIAAKGRAK